MPELELAFTVGQGDRTDYAGIFAFSVPDCVGVRLVKSRTVVGNGGRNLEWSPAAFRLLQQGAHIALLTKSDLAAWVEFYRAIDERGMLASVGQRVREASGLKRITATERAGHAGQLTAVLEANSDYLEICGVKELGPADGFDVLFCGEDGPITVPIYHVRKGEKEGPKSPFFVESVQEGAALCPGLILHGAGENKCEAYTRAHALAEAFRSQFEVLEEVVVPVVSEGQLNLWQKMGLSRELTAHIPDTNVTAEQVIRFLYFGRDTLRPGELARMGYSLPYFSNEFGLDVVFLRRGGPTMTRQFEPVNKILGVDLHRVKRGDWGVIPVNGVAGIAIVPDDWTIEQTKAHIADRATDFNRRTGGRANLVLFVNGRLFKEWQKRGSAFAQPEEKFDYGPLSRRVSYGATGVESGPTTLCVCRQKPLIGGVNYRLERERGGDTVIFMGDFGKSWGVETRAQDELTARERTKMGIRRSLGGELTMVPGVYDPEYLLASANYPGLFNPDDSKASFLRAELYHRGDREKTGVFLGKEATAELMRIGDRDERVWYREGDIVLAGVFLSHAHDDHKKHIALVTHEAPVYARTPTVAICVGETTAASWWRDRFGDVSEITAGYRPFTPYQRFPRELCPIHYAKQRIRFGNLEVEMHGVDHSILGTAMVGWSDKTQGWGLLYTSDLRMGPKTERAINECAGRFPVIMVETTNDLYEPKISAGFTENQVRDTLIRLIREHPRDYIIAIASPNNLERIASLMAAAEATGRHLAIDSTHAEIARQLRAFREMAPPDVEGFDCPLPLLGDNVALWVREMTSFSKYQKVLMALAGQGNLGVVDQWRLSNEPSKWIVVIPPWQLLRTEFSGLRNHRKIAALHATYFPFEAREKYNVADSWRWVRGEGGKFYADFDIHGYGGTVVPSSFPWGLHASGHASFREIVNIVDALLGESRVGKQIILTHGDHPGRYGRELATELGRRLGEVKIHSSLPHYDPRYPLIAPGFKLRLV